MNQSLKKRSGRGRTLGRFACAVAVIAASAMACAQEPAQKLVLPKAEAPRERVPPLAPRVLGAPAAAPPAAPARPVEVPAAPVLRGVFLRPGRVQQDELPAKETSLGAALNTSEELERLLERAIKIATERPDLAPVLWQRVLDEGASAFARAAVKNPVPLRRAYEIYRPFSNESLKAIVDAGAETLRYYRLHSDGPARALMARQGVGREAALSEVVRRYFLTSVGDDAAFELGCRLLERGDYISADQLFERLSLYPDSNVGRNAVSVRRAVTQAHLGRKDAALKLTNSLGGEFEGVKPLLVEEFNKTTSTSRSATTDASPAREPSGIADASALESAWELRPQWTLKGTKTSANTQAIMSGTGANGRPMIFVRQAGGNYVQTTLEDKDIPNIGFSQLATQWRSAGWRPASSPVVVDGRIYLKSESRTVCCDANTGEVLWMGRPTRFSIDDWSRQLAMVAAHGVSVSYPSATLTSGAQPKTMTEIMLFSDRLHHGLAISGGKVFAVEGDLDTPASRKQAMDANPTPRMIPGSPSRSQSRHNELACYDAATGRILWTVGRGTGLPEGASLWSKPLVVGSQLIIAIGIDSQLGIAALDVADGKLIWKTTLAEFGRAAPTIPVGLAVDDGTIYVASGAGTLFSVDRNGGALRWAASYPRLRSANVERRAIDGSGGERFQVILDENFVAREDDVVILAASDSDHVMAFNAVDGSQSWDAPIPPQVISGSLGYVVGMGNGRLHLASSKWLWTVNTRGGRIVWDLPLESSCGRGLLAGGSLLMTQQGTILNLDPATGKQIKKTEVTTPDQEPIGNLLASGDQILVASAARLFAMKPKTTEPPPQPEEKKSTTEGKQP